MTEKEFYTNVGYLANPIRQTNIEVEMPLRYQARFIRNYSIWTTNYPLPSETDTAPYYVWPPERNKWGVEMRVYFNSNANMPTSLEILLEPSGIQTRPGYESWQRRISTKKYIEPLLRTGFVLGTSQDESRIRALIPTHFLTDFELGYNL